MLDSFQEDGIFPSCNHLLKRAHKERKICGAQTFSSLAGILSGPIALLGSSDSGTSWTSRDNTYCPKSIVLEITASRGLQVSDAVGAGTLRFGDRVEVVFEQVSNIAGILHGKSRITTSPCHFVRDDGLLETRIYFISFFYFIYFIFILCIYLFIIIFCRLPSAVRHLPSASVVRFGIFADKCITS